MSCARIARTCIKDGLSNNACLKTKAQNQRVRQIPQKEALPGDIIILSDKKNYPKHTVMYDKVVNGDTLVNYSNGSHELKTGYKKWCIIRMVV